MAFLFPASIIPSGIQKRLLRYALSHFPVIDTETLDLDQLDIAWGKRSTVELRDVGLHVEKLAHVLHMPDELRPVTARILSLKITVPADIYSSGIRVEVRGIDIQIRLEPPRIVTGKKPGRADKSRAAQAEPSHDDFEDHIPTAQELAQSFLDHEPVTERQELEEVIQQADQEAHYDSDDASEASEEEASGTGVGLSTPAFLANFLKGIVDRLEVTISDVKFILNAIGDHDSAAPTAPPLSLHLGVSTVNIDGFTHSASATNGDAKKIQDRERRRVQLQGIYGDLLTEQTIFASLERIPGASSRHTSSVSQSTASHRTVASEQADIGDESPYRQLMESSTLSMRDPDPPQERSAEHSSANLPLSMSRSQLARSTANSTRNNTQPSPDLEDRFADASDDGRSDVDESLYQSQLYSSSLGAYDIPASDLEDMEDDLPFLMEDARSSTGYDSQELDPFAALSSTQDNLRYHHTTSAEPVRHRDMAATDPASLLRDTSTPLMDARRIYNSQPVPDRAALRHSATRQGAYAQPYQYAESSHSHHSMSRSSSSDSDPSAQEELAQSMLFSHEEAQSMYMSAMSEATSRNFQMPGGWDRRSASGSLHSRAMSPLEQSKYEDFTSAMVEHEESGIETPRPTSPSTESPQSSHSPQKHQHNTQHSSGHASQSSSEHTSSSSGRTVSKRLLAIDAISIWLPWSTPVDAAELAQENDYSTSPNLQTLKGGARTMPGTFSAIGASDIVQSTWSRARSLSSQPPEDSMASVREDSTPRPENGTTQVAIELENSSLDLDTSSTRLLYRLVELLLAVLPKEEANRTSARSVSEQNGAQFCCEFKSKAFAVRFFDCIPIKEDGSQNASFDSAARLDESIFKANIDDVAITAKQTNQTFRIDLGVDAFQFRCGDDPILVFEKPSFAVTGHDRQSLHKRQVITVNSSIDPIRGPEVTVTTGPASLVINLMKLDERLVAFGGVSGILDLSSSVASTSTVLAPSPVVQPRSAHVRFGNEEVSDEMPILSPVKVNARFKGFKVLLEGRACAVQAETATLAIVIRRDHARVKVEHIDFRAPFDRASNSNAAVHLQLVRTELRYLVSGVEEDFETLVSLIEPSGDRYEDDDGFLLDMLRRQRKNGSVLRISVDETKGNLGSIESVPLLQDLVNELARLSSGVTKYLPEDDRPGILVLPTLKMIHLDARLNGQLGLFQFACENIQAAHVGVPFLLGFKIGAVTLSRESEIIIDPLLQLHEKTLTPTLMGRFIGNVPEPRLKLKFFNLLVEYNISMMLAILGLADSDTVEDLAMAMAESIATLRLGSSQTHTETEAIPVPVGRASSKLPLRLDIFLRDCAIGLNPAKSNAKGLLLLSQAQISADDVSNDVFKAVLNLKRASLLLTDDVESLNLDAEPKSRSYDPDGPSPAVDDLAQQGFQPVASAWSLSTGVAISKDQESETRIEVDASNKLFTLETCADSTQTLFSILGGLSPPLPKKKERMYRTHVVPIENMMASFTGEPFVQGGSNHEQLPGEEGLSMEDADQILEDIPSNMDFVGSFYNPEDEPEDYSPSVLGSVNRLSSRLLAPSTDVQTSFAQSIEEQFEHGTDNVIIDPSEDYLEIFKLKAPVRRWNSKTAILEPVYESDVGRCPVKITARFEQITWNLYDGYDWVKTRDKIATAVERVEAQIEQRRVARRSSARDDDAAESEIADMLFQSIWIAVPANADERDLRRGINRQIAADDFSETASTRTTSVDTRTTTSRPAHARRKGRALRLERSRRKISFDLQKIVADLLMFPDGSEETQNSLALRVGDFEIYDHVPSSTWKKFTTYLHDAGERQLGRPMIRLDAITVKPVADLAATEMVIKVNVLPIRLHVDQDALDFLTRFFEFKDDKVNSSSGSPGPYIARLEVNTIPIKLDYKPKKVDYAGLRSGSTSEFANFIILDRAEFHLKRLILYGVQSPDLLHPKLKAIWTADVINNQLPTVLAGLSGIRPLVDVGSGVRDLIVIPIQEYKKDGRIVRSIQKGAVAFAKTTTSELARLGAKVAIGTQNVLEGAEGLLSPTEGRRSRSRTSEDWDVDEFSTSPVRDEPRAVSNYADQPLNVVTGLRNAWQGLERDLATAKDAIIAIGGDVRDAGSAVGAAGVIARLAPTVILRPAIGATRGVGMALLGAGNMLDKDSRRKIEDKYKRY